MSSYSSSLFLLCLLLVSSCDDDATQEPRLKHFLIVSSHRVIPNDPLSAGTVVTKRGNEVLFTKPGDELSKAAYSLENDTLTMRLLDGDTARLAFNNLMSGQPSFTVSDAISGKALELVALPPRDSIAGVSDFLARGQFSDAPADWREQTNLLSFGRQPTTYLFENAPATEGCLARTRYRRSINMAKLRTLVEKSGGAFNTRQLEEGEELRELITDATWSLQSQFGRQLLIIRTPYKDEVLFLDSLSTDGRKLHFTTIDKGTTWRFSDPALRLLRPSFEPIQLDGIAQQTVQTAEIDAKGYDGIISSRETDQIIASPLSIIVDEGELSALSLDFSERGSFRIGTPERLILSGEVRAHPTAPYLVANEGCSNSYFWSYEKIDEGIKLSIPLIVQLPSGESYQIGSKGKVLKPRYGYQEWVVRLRR